MMRHLPTLPSLLLLSACTGLRLPDPVPEAIDPTTGYAGEDTVVRITGTAFYPQLEVSTTADRTADVDGGFAVTLLDDTGTTASLEGVTLGSFTSLSAIVPAGLHPGVYDVLVTGPTGRSGALEDAFTVTSTRADRLDVDADDVVWTVHELATLTVTVVDPSGERILDDLEIEVSVEGDDVEGQVQFSSGSLEDQLTFGESIQGSVGSDGIAEVAFTVLSPQTVTVRAETTDGRSGIDAGTLKLQWDPGGERAVTLELPSDPYTAVAGVAFPVSISLVDQFGNLVTEDSEDIVLANSCGPLLLPIAGLSGTREIDVTATRATGTTCEQDLLQSVVGPSGTSTAFRVDPGEAAELQVEVSPNEIIAGDQLNVLVTHVDAWGNTTRWAGDDPTFTDSLGGVDGWTCFGGETRFCQVRSIVAGGEIVLEGQVDDLIGTSTPYRVSPDVPEAIALDTGAAPWVAGEPTVLLAAVYDVWGNPVPARLLDDDDLVVSDDLGEVSCERSGAGPAGEVRLECTLTTAGDRQLEVSAPAWSVTSPSSTVEVVNAALAVVEITPTVSPGTAGAPVPVELVGTDAWGNPYVVQTTATVDLTGDGSAGSTVVLDAAGEATGSLVFTVAGPTEVVASQGGVTLGRAPLTVEPAAPSTLDITVAEPWVWVDEAADVSVVARDAWGNRAAYDGAASVSTGSGAAGIGLTLVAGAATGRMTWLAPVTGESLTAEAGSLAGTSASFAVVAGCAHDAPDLDVTFGTGSPVACWDPVHARGQLAVSLAGSTPGAGSLTGYAFATGTSVTYTTGTDAVLDLDAIGAHALRLLVVQSDGCGAEATIEAWVGEDDGDPVGPLVLSAATDPIDVLVGSTRVGVVGATDCAGDIAVGGVLRLRTDRGELTGLTATGTGLELSLDATGSGAAILDASSVSVGGPATVHAWATAASGELTVDMVGDARRPRVWSVDPRGDTLVNVDTVVMGFSEAIGTASAADFSVTGPATVTVSDLVLVGDTAWLTLTPPADGTLGLWTVTASQDLRDTSGLRLDGERTGLASDHVSRFGDIPSTAPPVDTCAVDLSRFRPDGDPGTGEESDEVQLSFSAASSPAEWVVTVWSADGELLRHEILDGSATGWSWDGRTDSEGVVDAGTYTLEVDADDGFGNRGGACSTTVQVDHGNR